MSDGMMNGAREEDASYSLAPLASVRRGEGLGVRGSSFSQTYPPTEDPLTPALSPEYGGEGGLILAQSATAVLPKADRRRLVPPLPPVSLVTVEDARLLSSTGWERELDDFYVGILEFDRDRRAGGIIYKADNFRIVFDLVEGPVERNDLRMLGIIVKSLIETANRFRDAKIEFARERGLNPGEERLVLTDPAGNWLRITQSKPVM